MSFNLLPDKSCDVFKCCLAFCKPGNLVGQMLVSNERKDVLLDAAIDVHDVYNHPGYRINRAFECHFNGVVVAMTIGTCPSSKQCFILFIRQSNQPVGMASRKHHPPL